MKSFCFSFLIFICCSFSSIAQTIVIDEEENFPVAFASVFNQDGQFLGQTNVDGIMPDLGGATSIRISHIAYEPLKVDVKNIGKEIKVKQIQFAIGEVAIEKPKTYCIRLTGFLRNYTLTNQYYDDDDPVLHFYEGTGELYLFMNSKRNSDWMDLHVRNGKTGEMVNKRKGSHLNMGSKSLVERIKTSKKLSLQESSGYKKIIHNDTVIGTFVPDSANHIIRGDIDYLFPDTVRTINAVVMKLRITDWKNNYIYRMGEDDYMSQGDLMLCNSYMHLWTKALGMRIEHDSFEQFYVEKADFLTEDEYKAAIKEKKANKKNGTNVMTSDQLNQYMADHNIPAISEELQDALNISKKIQAAKAEKKKKQ